MFNCQIMIFTLSGATLTLNSQPPAGQIIVVNIYSKQFYRLGTVIYSAGALPIQELERVGGSELYHLLSSNLTNLQLNIQFILIKTII